MKKIYDTVDRFCARHPRFGIPNLMRYIVIGTAAVYILMVLTRNNDANALSFLSFNLNGLLHGEIWRIVTFIFVPGDMRPFWLIVALYFYYWIGSSLEREWGTARFTLYYLSGALLTVLGVVIVSLITGNHYLTIYGTGYVNLSMFLAFAVLFPDVQVLLFFIIPVKMKWLAYIDGAVFVLGIIQSLVRQHHADNAADRGDAELHRVHLAGDPASEQQPPLPQLASGHAVPPGRPPAAAAGERGLSPQVRCLRPHGHRLSRSAVPLLQQVRGVSLLLSGSYLFARSFYGVNMQAAQDLK